MRVLLFVLLAATATAQPDGLLVADRTYATIYASTADDLQSAIEEVSFAALQFETAFGEAPPPITVVVTDAPGGVSEMDLPDDGRPVLPFWSRRGLASAAPNAEVVDGAMLYEVDEGVRVVGVAAGRTGPFRAGDRITAVGEEPVASLDDWRRARGTQGPTAVTVERDGEAVVVEVEPGPLVPASRMVVATESQRPLSHEAGHFFLVAYARERGTAFERDMSRTYSGVPALPDWMDEAFATYCEIPSAVRDRDALLARQLAQAPPVDSLLTRVHPLIASGLLGRSPGDRAGRGPVMVAVSRPAAGPLRGSALFYAQSSSLVRYLAGAHGPRVFGRLVDRVLDGEAMVDALRAEGVDPATLDRDWRAWAAATAT